ncbi:PepSY domain-containing protein [Diaphorobacter ruginosibacter]|uniref:PepSY domain-containing protein n=1 Tax=Diaphorobacter ruginosibacter TaxID=1715720 RepID=UPI00333EFAEF
MSHSYRHSIAALAIALSVGGLASHACAQNAGAPAPAVAAAPAAAAARNVLTIRQIYDRLEAQGYQDIQEIELDHGRYEVKAYDAQGRRMKLYVNAATGAVESSKTLR